MFAIEVSGEFCASHQLRLPDGGLEPLHGHNWQVRVRVGAAQLDGLETVMDFHVLEKALAGIIAAFNHRHLNDIPPFDAGYNPSAERVAQRIAELLGPHITPPALLMHVKISEAAGCYALFWP
ncbi:MAG: 6-carboxytetrahydropterin synthase [Phycisphaerae bacterium]|nr:6-carboxytetrahydropterin synthase [Phycisphaerae bacterium]